MGEFLKLTFPSKLVFMLECQFKQSLPFLRVLKIITTSHQGSSKIPEIEKTGFDLAALQEVLQIKKLGSADHFIKLTEACLPKEGAGTK